MANFLRSQWSIWLLAACSIVAVAAFLLYVQFAHECMLKRCTSSDGWDCEQCRETNLTGLLEMYRRDEGHYPSSVSELHWKWCKILAPPFGLDATYRRTDRGYELSGSSNGQPWTVRR